MKKIICSFLFSFTLFFSGCSLLSYFDSDVVSKEELQKQVDFYNSKIRVEIAKSGTRNPKEIAAIATNALTPEEIATLNMLNDHIYNYHRPTKQQLLDELPTYIAARGREVKRDSNHKIIPNQFGMDNVSPSKQSTNSKNNEDAQAAQNAVTAIRAMVIGDTQAASRVTLVDTELSQGFETAVYDMHEAYRKVCLEMKIHGLLPSDDPKDLKISYKNVKSQDANTKIVDITIEGDVMPIKMVLSNGVWKMSLRSFYEYGAYVTR